MPLLNLLRLTTTLNLNSCICLISNKLNSTNMEKDCHFIEDCLYPSENLYDIQSIVSKYREDNSILI